MKKIDDISIFGEYKQPENRVTAAFLQICKIGGEDIIRSITNKLNIQLPSSDVDIFSQVKGVDTVPDGLLESNFSFKIYVETKIVKNSVNRKQLEGHLKVSKGENNYLLYLTPDEEMPGALIGGSVYWANWKNISDIINSYVQNLQSENKQLLEYLCQHFNTLLDNLNLRGYDWDLDNDNVIILAGGFAESFALNYSYYICQNKRNFKPARYLTFFNNNQIKYIFEIVERPKDDVDLRNVPELKSYVDSLEEERRDELCRIIKLKYIKEIFPIQNDTKDKNGHQCPYTYGQPRYTTIQLLEQAKMTSQL